MALTLDDADRALDEGDLLITDRGATDEMVAPFEALGLDVRRV